MTTKEGIISHGARIVLDYRRAKFIGKVKSLFTLAFWKSVVGLAVVFFMVGGYYTAASIFTLH